MNARRASSPYLLSGILKCETCGRAMSAAEAKSGKYTYYVCNSLLKRGSGTCKTPRLNAENFEKLIVGEIRENVLTESNIRDLVKLLDEEMDGVAREQRERLESIDEELEEVKRRLGRIWNAIETTDIEMADASDRIREHRERKERLEIAAEEARALLAERRVMLDSADVIATFAEEMSDFLKTSVLTETRAFVHSFVKEIEVKPGRAAIVYSIPTPEDSPMGGADSAEVALNGGVRKSVRHGGRRWTPAAYWGWAIQLQRDRFGPENESRRYYLGYVFHAWAVTHFMGISWIMFLPTVLLAEPGSVIDRIELWAWALLLGGLFFGWMGQFWRNTLESISFINKPSDRESTPRKTH